jgi:hypothetical protein
LIEQFDGILLSVTLETWVNREAPICEAEPLASLVLCDSSEFSESRQLSGILKELAGIGIMHCSPEHSLRLHLSLLPAQAAMSESPTEGKMIRRSAQLGAFLNPENPRTSVRNEWGVRAMSR